MLGDKEGIILRVKQLIELSGLKKSRFAIEVGINASNFGKKLVGNIGFSDNDIKLISKKLNVRIGWLLTGEGQMYIAPEGMRQQAAIDSYRAKKLNGEGQKFKAPEEMLDKIPAQSSRTKAGEGIPLIPTNAMAGSLTGDNVQIMPYDIESYFIVPAFAKSDFCIRVDGKSMEPTYCKGDIIACKYVPMADIWFQWGKVYVIATDQGVLVKHIEKGSDDEHIKLVSDNPEYMPFEIPTSGIYNIAVINGLIRVGDI